MAAPGGLVGGRSILFAQVALESQSRTRIVPTKELGVAGTSHPEAKLEFGMAERHSARDIKNKKPTLLIFPGPRIGRARRP